MAKDIWATKPIAERNVKAYLMEYVSKADKAPVCRCPKPVTHRDVDDDRICIYCGR